MKTVLVVAPGLLKISLTAYLHMLPEVELLPVEVTCDQAYRAAVEYQPDVMVMDLNLADPAMVDQLHQIRAQFPNMNCILLTDGISQRDLALSHGAWRALIKGLINNQLEEAILAPSFTVHSPQSTLKNPD